MRTVSSGLLAAQRLTTQRPRVQVIIRDKQPRFVSVGSVESKNRQNDGCLNGAGDVFMVSLDGSGVVRYRTVTDPSTMSGGAGGWGTQSADWTQITTGALAAGLGDVAISLQGSTLRVFYILADGSELVCRDSSDSGSTWGAEVTVKSWAGAGADPTKQHCVSSPGNDAVFYARCVAGERYVYFRKLNGSWGSEQSLRTMYRTEGEFAEIGGIGSEYVSGSVYRVVAGFWDSDDANGHIRGCKFTDGTGVSLAAHISPPGTATTGLRCWWPSLMYSGSGVGDVGASEWWLIFVEEFVQSGGSWEDVVCVRSSGFDHWSYKHGVDFDTSDVRRAVLVEAGDVIYGYKECEAYWVRLYEADDSTTELTEAGSRVLGYTISERAYSGSLVLLLDNRDGRYDGHGTVGETAEPIRSLASVYVDQGLLVSGSADRVECRPFYVWDRSFVRIAGCNWLQLSCVDGWKVLRLWEPDGTWSYTDKTVQWLIEELLYRVGGWSVAFDSSSRWSENIASFTIAVDTSSLGWLGRPSREVRRTRKVFLREPVLVEWQEVSVEPEGDPRGGVYIEGGGVGSVAAMETWVDPVLEHVIELGGGVTGYSALLELLETVGGLARFGNGDDLDDVYCFVPAEQGDTPSADHTYNDEELIGVVHTRSVPFPTRARATGTGVGWEGTDDDALMDVGREIFDRMHNADWTLDAQVAGAVEGVLEEGEAGEWLGELLSWPNVGLELFDIVVYTDSLVGAAGVSSAKRRVNEIVTRYWPLRRLWSQRVMVEQV